MESEISPSATAARIRHIAAWRDADKVLLCSGLTLPFALFWHLRLRAVSADVSIAPYTNLEFLPVNVSFTLLQAIAHALLVAIALVMRRKPDAPVRWLVHAEVQTWILCMSFSLWTIGPFTSPFSILIVGVPIFGLMLFEGRPVKLGLATLAVAGGLAILLPLFGVLPYAPHLAFAPFSNGKLSLSWALAFGFPSLFLAGLVLWVHASLLAQLRARQADLERISSTDALTGLLNRATLYARLEEEISKARRHKHALSVLMMDADHFKRINDDHGHLVGDDVLRRLGVEVRKMLRLEDIAARYGGEEIALILPHTPLEDAHIVAQRLLKLARGITFGERENAGVLTLSIGVAELDGDEKPDVLLSRADAALYESKRDGRDRASLAA